MPMNQGFLAEFDHEMATTRKFLERVPEGKPDWAPHPKSMKLSALSAHLAHMPGWVKETMERDALDIAPGGKPVDMPVPKTRTDLLALFDKNVAAGRTALAGATDDGHWMKPWALQANGQTIVSMPRVAVVRNFVLNHVIHHRAQLGVYLRMNEIPVPATYGPSADER